MAPPCVSERVSCMLARVGRAAAAACASSSGDRLSWSVVGRRLFGLKLAALYQYRRAQRRDKLWNQRSGDAIAEAKERGWDANKAVCSQLT